MVDQLAADYKNAGKQVLFLEQNQQRGWLNDGIRIRRFWAAYTNPKAAYPLAIVDSGHQLTQGQVSFYSAYKALVDAELTREPQAAVDATFWRVENHFEFQVNITNQSGVTLSRAANEAAVFVIVYEDMVAPLTKSVTSRLERAVVYQSIASPLNNNGLATFQLQTDDLSGVNWARLHAVAFVEYRPGGTTGAYDMLQAAVAVGPTLDIQPGSLTFTVDPDHPNDPEATLSINGSIAGMPWSVASKPGWADVTPSSGTAGGTARVHVHADKLQPGLNTGTLVFTTAYHPAYQLAVPIQVSYTPPSSLTVAPDHLSFLIDSDSPTDQLASLSITGYPPALTWSITSKPSWATVTPAAGGVGITVAVKVACQKLARGENHGVIRFFSASSGTELTQTIRLTAIYGRPWKLSFPFIWERNVK